MKEIKQAYLVGERALFNTQDLKIVNSTFAQGESPLKESHHLDIDQSLFKWKYPLWYSHDIEMKDSILFETARSGIWYTQNIEIKDSIIEAPKTFRRSSNIKLTNVSLPNATETFWNCRDITLDQVNVKGDYFAMNSTNMKLTDFQISGNYAFDGVKNIEVSNAKILSKDAFWNCENVVVRDSFIAGEYLAWNSKNITFINCTIESLQGLCYIENLVMKNCHLMNTTLAFEYSSVEVEIIGMIDSVMNPLSGTIITDEIGELILDETKIDPSNTCIKLRGLIQ